MPDWVPLGQDVYYWIDNTEDDWVLRLRYKHMVASCALDTYWFFRVDKEEVRQTILNRALEFKHYVDNLKATP